MSGKREMQRRAADRLGWIVLECEIENANRTIRELLEKLRIIADIGEGSTTANSLPHIARIARAEISRVTRL